MVGTNIVKKNIRRDQRETRTRTGTFIQDYVLMGSDPFPLLRLQNLSWHKLTLIIMVLFLLCIVF